MSPIARSTSKPNKAAQARETMVAIDTICMTGTPISEIVSLYLWNLEVTGRAICDRHHNGSLLRRWLEIKVTLA
jgi:hypothetical protein